MRPIEEYGVIGDCRTAALVLREGSIDWFCVPRFDSGACFSALVGRPEHGFWNIEPLEPVRKLSRNYRNDTLVLESRFETGSGEARRIDFMASTSESPTIVRMVEGIRGEIPMSTRCRLRFDYGAVMPWLQEDAKGITAIGGPQNLRMNSNVPLERKEGEILGEFSIKEGDLVFFLLRSRPAPFSADEAPPENPRDLLDATENWWREWISSCEYEGESREAVARSLIVLKALTYKPTGGILAAVTTSLPEDIGGVRNWDYRYCWIRDAGLILQALLRTGFVEEARQWHDWLLTSVAGDAAKVQIMYGITGRRRLPENTLEWLPGYEDSLPVREGNEAYGQFQLDVYGEIMICFYLSRKAGLPTGDYEWEFLCAMLEFLEENWTEKDEGIWEVRGENAHFTYSKFMCWVAFDRAIRAAREFELPGPVDKWAQLCDTIHQDVCRNGFDSERGTFVQAYGSSYLDASLLRMPVEGFLPADDPRMKGTIEAVEHHLIDETFVFRYHPPEEVDGLPGSEGAFIMCSFWLVDAYLLLGREEDARNLFSKILSLRNDLGLLSEEYDSKRKRLIGNFPQGLSHTSLINTAHTLSFLNRASRDNLPMPASIRSSVYKT